MRIATAMPDDGGCPSESSKNHRRRRSTDVGAPIDGPDEQNVSEPLTGLGVDGGLAVVPAPHLLVAYAQ
ncbi:hypothetical protein ACFVH0_17145 [Streptomyces sp. NPDC127117]|uniref:hypothetical protein n=1 Tax=Streptomyces sp. NPDC127117 TaxID=3345368 RepID=UPI00363D7561